MGDLIHPRFSTVRGVRRCGAPNAPHLLLICALREGHLSVRDGFRAIASKTNPTERPRARLPTTSFHTYQLCHCYESRLFSSPYVAFTRPSAIPHVHHVIPHVPTMSFRNVPTMSFRNVPTMSFRNVVRNLKPMPASTESVAGPTRRLWPNALRFLPPVGMTS